MPYKNKEDAKARGRRRYLKHKEEIKEKNKLYYLINKEEIDNRNRIFRINNEDIIKEKNRSYRANNKEVLIKKNKTWREKNKDVLIEKQILRDVNNRINLKDTYVRKCLISIGFKREQITPELIELKRITLKTKKLCLQLKN